MQRSDVEDTLKPLQSLPSILRQGRSAPTVPTQGMYTREDARPVLIIGLFLAR